MRDQWISLYNSGNSLREIASLFNCTHRTVEKHLRANGVKIRNLSEQWTFGRVKRVSDIDENCLLVRYEQGIPFIDIAKEFKISLARIKSILKKHGKVIIRAKRFPQVDEKRLLTLYDQGENLLDIAKQCCISYLTLRRVLIKHGKTTRRPWHNRMGKHGNWKGGRSIREKGYISVKNPLHPHADKRGYVLEHRLVMEKHLGRYLKPTEVVHHINGDLTDNRLSNLMFFPNDVAHRAFHRKLKD